VHRKKDRTCIRLTIIKGLNDIDTEGYAELIKKGKPDFIEVKAYMHVGASRERLKFEDMPWHEEIVEFTKELMNIFARLWNRYWTYTFKGVMCSKKRIQMEWKMVYVDWFWQWHKLIILKKDFDKHDFLKATPQTGLSGREIKKEVEEKIKRKAETGKKNKGEIFEVFVDEKTEEMNLE